MQWWKCVIKGDKEIDTSKVQPENRLVLRGSTTIINEIFNTVNI